MGKSSLHGLLKERFNDEISEIMAVSIFGVVTFGVMFNLLLAFWHFATWLDGILPGQRLL